MKRFLLGILLVFVIVGCSPSEKILCEEFLDLESSDKDWQLSKCYEEAAVARLNPLICNGIPGKVEPIETSGRIYSRSTCRNMVHNAESIRSGSPTSCGLIDDSTLLYNEPPEDARFKDSADLVAFCRDVINR